MLHNNKLKIAETLIYAAIITAGLCYISSQDYLLFHSLAEISSIIIAVCIFLFFWNTREHIGNSSLVLLGIGYLFIGLIDLIHTLSYKGMGVFDIQEANVATQLWIAARTMESITLLIATLSFNRKFRINRIFSFYTMATVVIFHLIFNTDAFPVCFVEGSGPTAYKIESEYFISAILLASIFLLFRQKNNVEKYVFKWLILSIFFTIIAELAFTFYISVYDISNLVGHLLKLASFYCIYKALIQAGLKEPVKILFHDLEQSKKRYQSVVETAGNIIIALSPKFEVIEWNRAAEKLFGKTRQEVYGKNCLKLFVEEQYQDIITDQFQKSLAGEEVEKIQTPVIASGNCQRIIQWNATRLLTLENEVLGITAIGHDVTEQNQAETERENLLKSLSEKNEEVSDFLRVMIYDLRSPVVNIAGFTEEIRTDFKKLVSELKQSPLDEETKENLKDILENDIPNSLEFISSSANKIDELINSLNKLSKIGRIELNLETVNMDDLAAEIVNTCQFVAKEIGASITIEKLPDCKGDTTQVNQVFTNLISNALKYLDTERKGQITLSGKVEDNMSVYCLADNGIGVTDMQKDKIFNVFYRVDPKGPVAGDGVGLTAVKQILERMQSRIWIESEAGKGSKFFVALPNK